MKTSTLLLALILVLVAVYVGTHTDFKQLFQTLSNEALTCEDPYIKVGLGCCLDKDKNKICDADELASEPSPTSTPSSTPTSTPTHHW